MSKSLMNIIYCVLLVISESADGAQELTPEESVAIIQRMMDSLPAGRWVSRGVLKTDHTKSRNDGEGVLVERITSYVEPNRVLQEFEVISRTGNLETPDARIRPEVKKRIDSVKQLGIVSPPATKGPCSRNRGDSSPIQSRRSTPP